MSVSLVGHISGAKTKNKKEEEEKRKRNRLFIFPMNSCSVKLEAYQSVMYVASHSQPIPQNPVKPRWREHLLHQRGATLSAERSLLRSARQGKKPNPTTTQRWLAKLVPQLTESARLCQCAQVKTSAIASVLLCAHQTGSYPLPVITDNAESRSLMEEELTKHSRKEIKPDGAKVGKSSW